MRCFRRDACTVPEIGPELRAVIITAAAMVTLSTWPVSSVAASRLSGLLCVMHWDMNSAAKCLCPCLSLIHIYTCTLRFLHVHLCDHVCTYIYTYIHICVYSVCMCTSTLHLHCLHHLELHPHHLNYICIIYTYTCIYITYTYIIYIYI